MGRRSPVPGARDRERVASRTPPAGRTVASGSRVSRRSEMTPSSGATTTAAILVARIERSWRPLLALLLASEAVLLCIAAEGRPFWHDEIATLLTAALPLAT